MASGLRVTPPAANEKLDAVRGSALGLVPEVLEHYLPLSRDLWLGGPLSPALLEMARLRNARRVNCTFCKSVRYDVARDAGLTEDKISVIDDNYPASGLSRREKLLLTYVDHYLDDPAGMDAEVQAALGEEFTVEELAHLSLALLLFNTFSRCAVSLGGLPDEMPLTVMSVPE
jgi:alkylhydroperoxidase family enzyme